MKPDYKRRYITRVYDMAETRLRNIFNIPNNEMVSSFEYDKQNSRLILKTLCDFDESQGDIEKNE